MVNKIILKETIKEFPNEQTLYIKHMICSICIRVVQEKLLQAGFPVLETHLGRVYLERALNPAELQKATIVLHEEGFELISTNKTKIVAQIKALILDTIYPNEALKNLNYSEYLSKNIGRDYSFLSHTFSIHENLTIEKYIILQKIERGKELLLKQGLALNQIANLLSYRSVGHFSLQFKKLTGTSPSEYRRIWIKKR